MISIDPGAAGAMIKHSAIPVKGMQPVVETSNRSTTVRHAASIAAEAISDVAAKRATDAAADVAMRMGAYFTEKAVNATEAGDLDMLHRRFIMAELAIR